MPACFVGEINYRQIIVLTRQTMNLPQERQGHLEDVTFMSVPELRELLERQENILQRKHLISKLPDKGEKTKAFASLLRKLIVDKSEKPGISTSTKTFSCNEGIDTDNIINITVANDHAETTTETLIEGERFQPGNSPSQFEEDLHDLSSNLKDLTLGKLPASHHQTSNSNYFSQLDKLRDSEHTSGKPKFMPNRPRIQDKHSYLTSKDVTLSKTGTHKLVTKMYEESAVHPPAYVHEETKLISMEESIRLLEDQKKKTEEAVAENAARRLAEQLIPKKEEYAPPASVDMQYRVRSSQDNFDIDSDDDAEYADDLNDIS